MDEYMNQSELVLKNIEEFSRIQNYMTMVEEDSQVFKAMKRRYVELKVWLTSMGVNLTELDEIKK